MKNKPNFLRQIKVKKIKRRLLQFLFGALRVKVNKMFFQEYILSFRI